MTKDANNLTPQTVPQSREDVAFEAAITRSLEHPPTVAIPTDFAARVSASLPTQPIARPRPSTARIVALGGAAAAVVALCCMAPHTAPSFQSLAFDMELALLAELAAIAGWLAKGPGGA